MTELPMLLGRSHPLVGVITEPAPDARRDDAPAVVIFNAGIVHRVGPSRGWVTLARRLATLGHLVVRFDHSGVGDSDPRRDNLPFDQAGIREAQEVMDSLRDRYGADQFVLIGLCSGAVTSFRTAIADERVVGAVLINAQGYDRSTEFAHYAVNRSFADRYLRISLLSPNAWWRALTGRIEYRRLIRVLAKHLRDRIWPKKEVMTVAERLAGEIRGLAARGVHLQFIHSAHDTGLHYLASILTPDEIAQLESSGQLQMQVISGSDHTFTRPCNRDQLIAAIEAWTRQFVPSDADIPAHKPSASLAVAAADASFAWDGGIANQDIAGRWYRSIRRQCSWPWL